MSMEIPFGMEHVRRRHRESEDYQEFELFSSRRNVDVSKSEKDKKTGHSSLTKYPLQRTGRFFRSPMKYRRYGRNERSEFELLQDLNFANLISLSEKFPIDGVNYKYQHPLSSHWLSREMDYNFSLKNKVSIWRELWIQLAIAQKRAGLNISQEQIHEMQTNAENIDFEYAKSQMDNTEDRLAAHLLIFQNICPSASSIMNLGITGNTICTNANLILMREGLDLITEKLVICIDNLSAFALEYKGVPTVSYVHFQPSQLVTVGKRTCLWIDELLFDLQAIGRCRKDLRFLGVKDISGNQKDLMSLFHGNNSQIKTMETEFCRLSGFNKNQIICGESYSKKVDLNIISRFSSLGSTVHKIATDIKLLCSLGEFKERLDEEDEEMKPKQCNLLKSQQCCDMAQHLISLFNQILPTAGTQWLEESSNEFSRDDYMAQAFITCDAMLNAFRSLISKLIVNVTAINLRTKEELPFLVTDLILVEMIMKGKNRIRCQTRLETIENALAISIRNGKSKDFATLVKEDPFFSSISNIIELFLNPEIHTGRAQKQVEEFIKEEVKPILKSFMHSLGFRQYGNF